MRFFVVGFLFCWTLGLNAQDELSGEIEKLEAGQIEKKETVVPEDPTESASEVETELEKDMAAPNNPEKTNPLEESPEDEVVDAPGEPAPPLDDDDFESVEEEVVEEPTPVEPPQPIVEEPAIEEEAPLESEIVEEPAIEAPAPVAQEPMQEYVPDDFEERLHRIYNQFYTETTNNEMWTQIAGEKIKEIYVIQPGDTLWDVSVTFFGNGHYWPKVWQMNEDITNPHLISPGYQLKFTPGSIDSAPSLNIVTNDQQSAQQGQSVAAGPSAPTSAELTPYIPPPTRKSNPVLETLPPSLPFIKSPLATLFDQDGFVIDQKKPNITSAKYFIGSYLSEEEPVEIGEVVETDDEYKGSVGIFEPVFVRIDSGARRGDKFLVYQIGEKIKDHHGRKMGYPVILEGEIKVDVLVNENKKIYKAFVTRNISAVQTGSLLTKGRLIETDLSKNGDTAPISAEIVGGDLDNKRLLLGAQDVVYLNQGANQGVKEGQLFSVLRNQKVRNPSTQVENLKDTIAQIKIVKATPTRSTAIVIDAMEEIRNGDYIGSKVAASKTEEMVENPDDLPDSEQDNESETEADEYIEE